MLYYRYKVAHATYNKEETKMERIYERSSETAKKVRKALKEAFPGVTFSVTSSTYSMGSSVDVRWTDGPMTDQVESITALFKSSSFDGMQDMKITSGYLFEGKLYSGADYVHTNRTLTPDYRASIEAAAAAMYDHYDKNAYGSHRMEKDAEREMLGIKDDETASPAIVVESPQVPTSVTTVMVEPTTNVIDFASFRAKKMQMAVH